MKQRIIFCGIALLFITVGCLAFKGFIRSRSDISVPVKSMDTWQQADAPLGFPLNTGEQGSATGQLEPATLPPFDSRLIQLSPFERALLPTVTRMSAPMGSENGALTYNAQPFWENNNKRGGHHAGDDFNGIGGMNTDLGDPIYAIASGLVVYRGEPSPGWGNTLILAHRTPQDSIQLFMYAHMDQIHIALGSIIPRSSVLGTVGTANHNYPAHLHLEMHDSSGVYIGRGYTSQPGDRIDPAAMISQQQPKNPASLSPSPFSIMIKEQIQRKKESLTIKHDTSIDK